MTYATFTQFIPSNYDYLAKQSQINNTISKFTSTVSTYAEKAAKDISVSETKTNPVVTALSLISDIPVLGEPIKIAAKTVANASGNVQVKEALAPITVKPDFLTNVAPIMGGAVEKIGSAVGSVANGFGKFFGAIGSNIWWIIGGIGLLLIAMRRR